jgi:hypothetical protein
MGNVIKNRSVSIFEAAGFMEEKRANKAALILKRALHPDTVLFEFNANTLEKEEAYGIITQQVGRTHGFRPISDFRPGNRGNLLIEAKFIDKQDAGKACQDGVTHEGVQYRATPSIEGAEKNFARVNMSHLPLTSREELSQGLCQSMARYGKVCQIIIYTTDGGYFEGDATVVLDCTTPEPGTTYDELMRMLYLESWNNYFPATFQGAPPVCYMCRLTGHVKKDCPELAALRCYKCNELGHVRYDCKRRKVKTHSEDAKKQLEKQIQVSEEAEAAKPVAKESNSANSNVDDAESLSTKFQGSKSAEAVIIITEDKSKDRELNTTATENMDLMDTDKQEDSRAQMAEENEPDLVPNTDEMQTDVHMADHTDRSDQTGKRRSFQREEPRASQSTVLRNSGSKLIVMMKGRPVATPTDNSKSKVRVQDQGENDGNESS